MLYEKIERDFILKLKLELVICNICNIFKKKERKEKILSYSKWFMYILYEYLIYERYENECMRVIKWVVFYGYYKIL